MTIPSVGTWLLSDWSSQFSTEYAFALLREYYHLIILPDSAFGSSEFLHQIRHLKRHAVVGTTKLRTLADGRRIT